MSDFMPRCELSFGRAVKRERDKVPYEQTDFAKSIGTLLANIADADAYDAEMDKLQRERALNGREEAYRVCGIPEQFANTRQADLTVVAGNSDSEDFVRTIGQARDAMHAGYPVHFLMCGHAGRGKTMGACALLHEVMLTRKKTVRAVYEPYAKTDEERAAILAHDAQKIARYFSGAYVRSADLYVNRKLYEAQGEVISSYLQADLLVIDEVGRSDDKKPIDAVRRIIQERYDRRKSTVLISNMTRADIEELLGEATWSRFKSNTEGRVSIVADMGSLPDFRTKSKRGVAIEFGGGKREAV